MTFLAYSVDGAFFRGYGGSLFAGLARHGLGTAMDSAVLDEPRWFCVCVWCKPANDVIFPRKRTSKGQAERPSDKSRTFGKLRQHLSGEIDFVVRNSSVQAACDFSIARAITRGVSHLMKDMGRLLPWVVIPGSTVQILDLWDAEI